VLPGIVGTIQATEAIKILLDIGNPLSGRLLTFDTLTMTFRPLKTYQDPECPICSEVKAEAASPAPAAVG